MIKKILGFIFRLILIAVIIGVPCTWMIRRSYNNPEVHYYEREEQKGKESLRFPIHSDLNGYVFAGSNFFTSIGKPLKGALLSLVKQLIVLLPLLVIGAYFFGLDGITYSSPITDCVAFVLTTIFLMTEFKKMPKTDLI